MDSTNYHPRILCPEITFNVEITEDLWTFDAIWKGRSVGYAWCWVEDGKLSISDIKVEDALVIPWNRIIPQFLPQRKNFRRKGIGSGLMRLIIKTAIDHNLNQIHAKVSSVDLEFCQTLMLWYEEFGFKKSLPDTTVPLHTSWLVDLDLPTIAEIRQ